MKIYIDVSHYFRDPAGRGVDRVVSEILRYIPGIVARQGVDVAYVAEFDDGILRETPKPEPLATSDSSQPDDESNKLSVGHLLKAVIKRVARLVIPYGLVLGSKNSLSRYRVHRERNRYPKAKFKAGEIMFCPDAGWIMKESYIKALRSAKEEGAKIVPLFYDLIPVDYPDFFQPFEVRSFSGWLDEILLLADHALSISDSTRARLIRKIADRNVKFKIETTLLGADFRFNTSSLISDQVVAAFETQRPYLVVGTMETRKNQELVLKSFQNLWDRGINAKIVFAGSVLPSSKNLYERMMRLPQWGNLLRVLQGVKDHELSFCYANAKALIAPSLAEGFDLPVVEALHYSLPVFASNIDVHKEIARSRPIYFDPDSLDHLTSKLEQFENQSIKLSTSEGHQWPTWEESIGYMFKKILDFGKQHGAKR